LLPSSTDRYTRYLTDFGLWAIFESLKTWEREEPLIEPPISVSSSHTKHALEDLHQNICVFRHPDHLPDKQTIASDFMTGLQNIKLTAATAVKLPGDALAALYGTTEDTVLYWAHHEKLCLVDGHTAFMGGLDLCYGRWDTNQHSIADAHPGDVNRIVFAGQDYNNSRIMDFQDVTHWQNNKLDRTQNSRMGWSDISICLQGPVVQDLQEHFIQRWNFIYDEKYQVRKDARYSKLVDLNIDGAEDRGLFDQDRLVGPEGGLRQKIWKAGKGMLNLCFHLKMAASQYGTSIVTLDHLCLLLKHSYSNLNTQSISITTAKANDRQEDMTRFTTKKYPFSSIAAAQNGATVARSRLVIF